MSVLNEILVVPTISAIEVAFNQTAYRCDLEKLQTLATACVQAGQAIGFDLCNAEYGLIKVNYNPTTGGPFKAMDAAKRLREYILSTQEP